MNNNLKKILSVTACATLLFASEPIVSSAPTITLKATPGCNEIKLSWNKIDIASFYQPFMAFDDGSAYPLTDFPTAEAVFVHKNLEEGKQYCYLVKAFDKDSKEALKSEKVCAKTECKGNGNIGDNITDDCKIVLDFQIGNKEYKINGRVKGIMTAAPKIGVGNRTMIVVKYFIDEYGGTSLGSKREKSDLDDNWRRRRNSCRRERRNSRIGRSRL